MLKKLIWTLYKILFIVIICITVPFLVSPPILYTYPIWGYFYDIKLFGELSGDGYSGIYFLSIFPIIWNCVAYYYQMALFKNDSKKNFEGYIFNVISIVIFAILALITGLGINTIFSGWSADVVEKRIEMELEKECCLGRQTPSTNFVYKDCPYVMNGTVPIYEDKCTSIDDTSYCEIPFSDYILSDYVCKESIIENEYILKILFYLYIGNIIGILLISFVTLSFEIMDYVEKKNNQYQLIDDEPDVVMAEIQSEIK